MDQRIKHQAGQTLRRGCAHETEKHFKGDFFMHASIAKKLAKKMKRQAGFTLLEILVVLTIMGFLIAMVAPRLAGISSGAVDTVCDSNQQRQIQMTAAYFEKTGKFPNKMTSLVIQNDDEFTLPAKVNGDPSDGPEVLAEEFVNRVQPKLHILTQKEADELAGLGITRIFYLNDYSGSGIDSDHQGTPMQEVLVAEGVAVMMSGIGIDDLSGNFTSSDATDLVGYGEADFLGRIVLGFGPENGLITSGLVSNAAHCPGGIQDADNVTYNDYNLVLPRLKATVARNDNLFTEIVTNSKDAQYLAFGYTEDFEGDEIAGTVDTNGIVNNVTADAKARVFNFAAQPSYQYATMCPEGHMFPADDNDFWGVVLGSVTVGTEYALSLDD